MRESSGNFKESNAQMDMLWIWKKAGSLRCSCGCAAATRPLK